MLSMIVFLLILIAMLLSAQLALTVEKARRKKEWIPIGERPEDRKIQKEHRAVERERSEKATKDLKLMQEVADYDGNIR